MARVRRVDAPFKLLTLLLLAFVVMTPFATELMATHGPAKTMLAYCLLVAAAGVVQAALFGYAAFGGRLLDGSINRRHRIAVTAALGMVPLLPGLRVHHPTRRHADDDLAAPARHRGRGRGAPVPDPPRRTAGWMKAAEAADIVEREGREWAAPGENGCRARRNCDSSQTFGRSASRRRALDPKSPHLKDAATMGGRRQQPFPSALRPARGGQRRWASLTALRSRETPRYLRLRGRDGCGAGCTIRRALSRAACGRSFPRPGIAIVELVGTLGRRGLIFAGANAGTSGSSRSATTARACPRCSLSADGGPRTTTS